MNNSRRSLRAGRVAISLALTPLLVVAAGWFFWKQSDDLPAQVVSGTKVVRMVDDRITLHLTLGLTDRQATDWSGRISVEPGKVVSMRDLDTGQQYLEGALVAKTVMQNERRQNRQRQNRRRRQSSANADPTPVRLEILLNGSLDSTVTIDTAVGKFSFAIAQITMTSPLMFLDDAARVVRRPNLQQLTDTTTHDDFPAASVDSGGAVWCAYVAYHKGVQIDSRETAEGRFESLRTRGNGDQVRLMRFADGAWSRPVNVTARGLDIWRPTVVTGSDNEVWVIWSQQVDGNWDLYARRFDAGRATFGSIHRLTDDPGADLYPVATPSSQGIWIAWQARRQGNFDVLAARLSDLGAIRSQRRVSDSPANDWNPTIAAGPNGDVWIAWDTYDKGDYDVYARRLRDGDLGQPVAVATSSRFEARPHVTVDNRSRPWVAFENGDSNWGKDYGPRLTGDGLPFYYERTILVRCVDDDLKQPRSIPDSPPIYTHYDDTRYQAEFKRRVSMPRLAFDHDGRLWLLYRRHPAPENARGEIWASYAQFYQAGRWSGEIPLGNSENLLDNRPALAPLDNGRMVVVHSCDGRTDGARSHQVNNLNMSILDVPGRAEPLQLVSAVAEGAQPPVPPADPREAEHVQRCRNYRINAGGKTYQLLRGEFHRHTEVSAHRDWDGPLEEVWRYGLDVASMDWIGPGDHDYGVGHEYLWWFTQKQIDLYYAPRRFLSMYTYERSKGYPSGHRNVMFAQRGIRTLPHLTGQANRSTPAEGEPDIHNLYRYLKYFGGICSSHTSATNMGTDWRDSDPEVEPVVEIFQGHRQNYEETNAPLAARGPDDTIQGYRPAGFVWEAFKKGVRLGFQSSSDHVSTHTSYAFVLAEEPTRTGLIEAFKKRHSYAANDNIVMDVRCGEHIMGDEFNWEGKPSLSIRVIGTAPIAALDIIRQVGQQTPEYVYRSKPGSMEVDTRWTDDNAGDGLNMYYVRIQQKDQRLAWASPMWIHCQ